MTQMIQRFLLQYTQNMTPGFLPYGLLSHMRHLLMDLEHQEVPARGRKKNTKWVVSSKKCAQQCFFFSSLSGKTRWIIDCNMFEGTTWKLPCLDWRYLLYCVHMKYILLKYHTVKPPVISYCSVSILIHTVRPKIWIKSLRALTEFNQNPSTKLHDLK